MFTFLVKSVFPNLGEFLISFFCVKTPLKFQFFFGENEMTAQYRRAWWHEKEKENNFISLSSRSSLSPSSFDILPEKKKELKFQLFRPISGGLIVSTSTILLPKFSFPLFLSPSEESGSGTNPKQVKENCFCLFPSLSPFDFSFSCSDICHCMNKQRVLPHVSLTQ